MSNRIRTERYGVRRPCIVSARTRADDQEIDTKSGADPSPYQESRHATADASQAEVITGASRNL